VAAAMKTDVSVFTLSARQVHFEIIALRTARLKKSVPEAPTLLLIHERFLLFVDFTQKML